MVGSPTTTPPRRAWPSGTGPVSVLDSTCDRLRDDIDRGRTGDKVAWPDLAAAPLGTDEEAAGVAPSKVVVAAARAIELRQPFSDADAGPSGVLVIALFGAVLPFAALVWILW